MNWHLIKVPVQLVGISCAVLLALWAVLPGLAVAVGLFGAAAVFAGRDSGRVEGPAWTLGLRWVSFSATVVSLILLFYRTTSLDVVHTAIPWLGALAAILAWWKKGERGNDEWRRLAFIWAFSAAILLLAVSYLANHWIAFHFSLFSIFALCLLLKRSFQLPLWRIQVLNTAILLTVLLPIADRFLGARPPGEKKWI